MTVCQMQFVGDAVAMAGIVVSFGDETVPVAAEHSDRRSESDRALQ